jgi:hypothetical protein
MSAGVWGAKWGDVDKKAAHECDGVRSTRGSQVPIRGRAG